MSARAVAVPLAAAVLVTATGCGSSSSSAPAPGPTSASSGASSGSSAGTSSAPASGAPSSVPTPMLTPTAPARSALGTGQRAWAAFSQRGLPRDDWWSALRPLLSPAARATYVYDDPSNLPAMSLTGDLRVAASPPGDPQFTAEVDVPTDRGTFRLDLERHDRSAPWLLYAIRFPHGVQ